MDKISKFMIVSNARTGSTWLELMLSQLFDVDATKEFKLTTNKYKLSSVHIEILDNTFSADAVLNEIASKSIKLSSIKSPVVGSKLVLDPWDHSCSDYKKLSDALELNIKIVHLTRSLEDIFLSWSKGVYHKINVNNFISSSSIALEYAKQIKQNLGESTLTWSKLVNSINKKSISNRILNNIKHKMHVFRKGENDFKPLYMPPSDCEATLSALLKNDLWIASLRTEYKSYKMVDYNSINKQFSEIAKMIGSNETQKNIRTIIKKPITSKLPILPIKHFFLNWREVYNLCKKYEEKRLMMIKNM